MAATVCEESESARLKHQGSFENNKSPTSSKKINNNSSRLIVCDTVKMKTAPITERSKEGQQAAFGNADYLVWPRLWGYHGRFKKIIHQELFDNNYLISYFNERIIPLHRFKNVRINFNLTHWRTGKGEGTKHKKTKDISHVINIM